MGDKSAIEWTDATWNPIVGCSLKSPGCTNCYAMGQASRLLDKPGSHYEGTTKRVNGKGVWTGKVALAPDAILSQPTKWKRPRRIFVNSMGDVFHEDVPVEWIAKVFNVMAENPHHIFQLLTKRADRMMDILSGPKSHDLWSPKLWHRSALPNVWLGVSVEDQAAAFNRIPFLIQTPAAVRFLSCEPLLGPVDITAALNQLPTTATASPFSVTVRGHAINSVLHWVIAGGESGHGARPVNPGWVRALRDECLANEVPFFFKQWGEWQPALSWNPAKVTTATGEEIAASYHLYENGRRIDDGKNLAVLGTTAMQRVGNRALAVALMALNGTNFQFAISQ